MKPVAYARIAFFPGCGPVHHSIQWGEVVIGGEVFPDITCGSPIRFERAQYIADIINQAAKAQQQDLFAEIQRLRWREGELLGKLARINERKRA
jgi:hypothetical protein